ncbi:hypothetical protein [Massilia sp. Root335]|uniref:hypothetical protein n=1 Tax=Massilia sp. Root335 TaxID=1736517 RepID=UPI000A57F11F|nr:hypothetical protein [Massilia sp. Root335]
MKAKTCMAAVLMVHAAVAQADTTADTIAPDDHGAYLSVAFGNGRIYGGNASGYRWMRGRTFEVRAGRQQDEVFGLALPSGWTMRVDFVHYNEGHPDNNHRDGFALQWLAVHRFSPMWTGELGAGPYLSMNTTEIATPTGNTQIDDARLGVLLSAGLRLAVPGPSGTHVRLGYNHVAMHTVHRSDALVLGIGRQFGAAEPAPDVVPDGRLWLGGTFGTSITNMAGTHGAHAGVLEARQYAERWGIGYKFLFEGDDGARVDRRGLAGQLWYVQPVTPRLSMSAGLGPYVAANRRDGNRTATNLLISFQAERALSARTRAIVNFNRIKTFRKTNDRDLFQIGLLRRF